MLEGLLLALALAAFFVVGWLIGRRSARGAANDHRDLVHSTARQVAEEQRREIAQHSEIELEKRRAAIESMLKPFDEKLEKLAKETRQLETERKGAYVGLAEKIAQLQSVTLRLDTHSQALATALKGSTRARGRWGEIALRNIAEMAGMSRHCDFTEQTSDASGRRPDMLVKYPQGGAIPVDAKVPLSAYMAALEATDPERRQAHLAQHAKDLRQHVRELAKRDYAEAAEGSLDFTVMFVPADPVLAAAFEVDPDLFADAVNARVLIVTPATLIALLKTIGVYWQQDSQLQNTRQVWDTAHELLERMRTFAGHLRTAGSGLKTAVTHFDKAVGSWQHSVRPQLRRIEELEDPTKGASKLPEVDLVDQAPRELPGEGDGEAASGAAG